jgi:hypothetical protein
MKNSTQRGQILYKDITDFYNTEGRTLHENKLQTFTQHSEDKFFSMLKTHLLDPNNPRQFYDIKLNENSELNFTNIHNHHSDSIQTVDYQKMVTQIRFIYWKLNPKLSKAKIWLMMGLWLKISENFPLNSLKNDQRDNKIHELLQNVICIGVNMDLTLKTEF